MTSDLYNQIVSQRGSFERLLARIPGFRGYLEKASRRTADTLLRNYMADQLKHRVQRFISIEQKILSLPDGLMQMSKTSVVKASLQHYRDRIAAAVPEFSGFAEAIKVDESGLDRLYSFDEAQIRYIDQLDSALDGLEGAVDKARVPDETGGETSGFDAELDALAQLIRDAQNAFDLRDQVLTDLHKAYAI